MNFNWEFILSFTLAFCLLFVIFMTLGFYVSYKRDQQLRKMQVPDDPLQGRYFKRYLPDDLKRKYDTSDVHQAIEFEKQRYKRITRTLVAIPAVIFIGTVLYFIVAHRELFYSPITLTDNELARMDVRSVNWKPELSPSLPSTSTVSAQLSGRELRLVYARDDMNWKLEDSPNGPAFEAHSAWKTWANGAGMKSRDCLWENFFACWGGPKNGYFVVLPGRWDLEKLDFLVKSGARVLVIGAPLQIFNQAVGFLEWKGIKFVREVAPSRNYLAVGADGFLTVGWDPGTILESTPIVRGYRIETKHAEGFRLNAVGDWRGGRHPGLMAGVEGIGRWVWADYHPTRSGPGVDQARVLEALNSSIFRFLSGQEYSGLAAWPKAAQYAGFSVAHVTDDVGGFRGLESFADQSGFPITWAVSKTAAESNRRWLQKASEKRETMCLVEIGTRTLSVVEKARELAVCTKAIRDIAKINVGGVRAAGDFVDEEILSAVHAAGLGFVLSGPSWQMSPEVFLDPTSTARLLRIGRTANDDHFFVGTNKMSAEDIRQAMSEELDLIKELRGLHVFGFHGQYGGNPAQLKMLQDLDGWYKQDSGEIFLAGPSEVSKWWRLRRAILSGVPLKRDEMQGFEPKVVAVDSEGKISFRELSESDMVTLGRDKK